MTMAQFDVFENPIISARHAFPYVVTLQADIVQTTQGQIIAPLVPAESMAMNEGRLMPMVSLRGANYRVLVPALTGVRSRDLRAHYDTVAFARSELLAALDYLFFDI